MPENFGQTVRGMDKGAGGIGKAVSALAKAKVKPERTPKAPAQRAKFEDQKGVDKVYRWK